MLDIPIEHWSKTAFIDWAGYDSRYGQSTALNAMYYATLLDAATIAEVSDDLQNANTWQQKSAFHQRANKYASL